MDFSIHDCYQHELYRASFKIKAEGFFGSQEQNMRKSEKQQKIKALLL